MNKNKTLLILWIIFGFVFIQAVDSVLFFVIHLIYFAAVTLEVPFSILKFLLPVITAIIYLAAVILILKKIKINPGSNKTILTRFPKNQFIILLFLAILLHPLTNKLSGLFAEYCLDTLNQNSTVFLEFYGWMHAGIGLARWVSVIALAVIYLNKYRKE